MAADLFGLGHETPRKKSRPEAAALVEVLKTLLAHSAAAWCERIKSGAVRIGGRFLRFVWRGY